VGENEENNLKKDIKRRIE